MFPFPDNVSLSGPKIYLSSAFKVSFGSYFGFLKNSALKPDTPLSQVIKIAGTTVNIDNNPNIALITGCIAYQTEGCFLNWLFAILICILQSI